MALTISTSSGSALYSWTKSFTHSLLPLFAIWWRGVLPFCMLACWNRQMCGSSTHKTPQYTCMVIIHVMHVTFTYTEYRLLCCKEMNASTYSEHELLQTHFNFAHYAHQGMYSLHCPCGSLTFQTLQLASSQPPHGCQYQQVGGHSHHPTTQGHIIAFVLGKNIVWTLICAGLNFHRLDFCIFYIFILRTGL